MIVNKYQGNGGGGGGSYVLPAATTSTLGGVKIGSGITVQPDGTISAEGGSGEAAYKIELSTSIPDDFTQEDIANLNAFFAAVEADPSIAESAYVMAESTDIYRCSYSEYDSENHYGNFMFDLNMANDTRQIELGFEDGEYVNGGFISWNSSTIIPTYDFPADPIEGQIANYDDGQGNIGLYRYDGTDWVPFGGGDNTVLKASSGTPENIVAGDVYAKPSGTEKMTYNSFQLYRLSCSRNLAQYTENGRIADMTVTDGHGWSLRYYRTEGTSGDEMLQYIVDGAVKQEFNLSTYEPTGTDVFFDYTLPGIGFRVLSRNAANQAQLYLYTPYNDPAPTITYTDGPNAGGKPNINPQVRYMDVTVDVPTYDVFQAGGMVEKFYATITGEGSYTNAIDDADAGNVFWLNAGTNNKMVITFNDMTAGKRLMFFQNVNDELFRYIASDENGNPFSINVYDQSFTLLFTIPEGESTQVLGGETTYYSFSGNVLTISRENGGNFESWQNDSIGYALGEEKLVKADDVEGKLLPDADPNYGLVLQYNSEPEWVHPSNLTALQLINIQTDGEGDDYPTFLARTDSQEFRWKKMSVLEAVTEDGIPSGAKEGSVWSTNNTEDGISIKQHQGLSSTETEWIYKDDIPKDRDYSIYSYRVDVTDPNTYAQINFDIEGCTNNITWAEGAWKSSDIELTDDGNGVYTGSSECGWSVSAWTSGSYFYVSCDYSIEDGINIYDGGEWYVEVPKPVAANVVTSTDIKRMVKISQADYTALAVKDPETMYIIIG